MIAGWMHVAKEDFKKIIYLFFLFGFLEIEND
jgi:hypothetical protein